MCGSPATVAPSLLPCTPVISMLCWLCKGHLGSGTYRLLHGKGPHQMPFLPFGPITLAESPAPPPRLPALGMVLSTPSQGDFLTSLGLCAPALAPHWLGDLLETGLRLPLTPTF